MKWCTKGCREVMEECSFLETDYRLIEQTLLDHIPQQVIQLVQRKDPGGNHPDFKWFVQIFERYPKTGQRLDLNLSEEFWQAYDYLSEFVEDDFWIEDMELIAQMATRYERLRLAVGRSKPNIRYVYKVWLSLEALGAAAREMNKPEMVDLTKHEIKRVDI